MPAKTTNTPTNGRKPASINSWSYRPGLTRSKWLANTIMTLMVWALGYCSYSHSSDNRLMFQQIEPFLNTADIPTISADSASSEITITAAGNEYEPARVLLEASTDFGVTTASISALSNPNGDSLPSNAIELRNVLRWTQLIPHAYKIKDGPRTHVVDELLVFDSTQQLSGTWKDRRYLPPTANTEFKTVVKSGAAQQLWLTVYIGDNQPAGIYKGTVTLQGEKQSAQIPLQVEVLPYTLPEPDKTFGIFFRGSLANNKRHLSKEALQQQFLDIKQHGFNSLVINEYDPETVADFISAIAQAGITGPIVLNYPEDVVHDTQLMEEIYQLLDQAGLKQRYIYGVDEPNTEERMEMQRTFSRDAPEDALIFTSLRTDTDDTLTSQGINLDWGNFNIRSGLESLQKKANLPSRTTTYYWQSYLEDAPRNRYYTGAFLLKTGLDGVFPYVYQAFHDIDPYVNDERDLRGRKIRASRRYKAFNSNYPTTGSPIPTIQWESAREGIDDYRYIQRLLNNLRVDESSQPRTRTQELQGILKKIEYRESRPFAIDQNFDASRLTDLRTWAISNLQELSK